MFRRAFHIAGEETGNNLSEGAMSDSLSARIAVIVVFIVFCGFSSTALPGQEAGQEPFRHRGTGYVYYGAGAPMSDSGAINYPLGIGGGGEVFLMRGLAAGADFGYCTNPDYRDVNYRLFSADVSLHRNPAKFRRVDPFAVGGLGLLNTWSTSWSKMGFVGFGLDAWIHRHLGLRLETRVYGSPVDVLGTVRVGLLLR
jgi:hypothetical protein